MISAIRLSNMTYCELMWFLMIDYERFVYFVWVKVWYNITQTEDFSLTYDLRLVLRIVLKR